jgi:hypothetical protein
MSADNHSRGSRTRRDTSSLAATLCHIGWMLAIGASLMASGGVAYAQSYPGGGMGGGMGGMGGRGRGMGGPRGGGGGQQSSGPSTSDMVKDVKELGALKDALHKVDGLTNAQKDSLGLIEKGYGRIFESLGIHLLNMLDSAHSAGGPQDFVEVHALEASADSVRSVELRVARDVLLTDAQRSRFDENVAKLREESEKREQAMQRRRRRES